MGRRRYSVSSLAPEDAVLEVDGREYPIPDALTIPMMQKFMQIAKEIERSGDDPDAAVSAMNDAHAAIVEYVRLRTPDASFQLDVNGVVGAIAFIVGNEDGPEQEVIDALADAGGKQVEAVEGGQQVELDDESGPTPPETPSSSASSD